eukprot:3473792-Amphidinium_carterae.3
MSTHTRDSLDSISRSIAASESASAMDSRILPLRLTFVPGTLKAQKLPCVSNNVPHVGCHRSPDHCAAVRSVGHLSCKSTSTAREIYKIHAFLGDVPIRAALGHQRLARQYTHQHSWVC